MTYTNRRRAELNQALFSRLQNPTEEIISDGSTHIYLKRLPKGAVSVSVLYEITNEIRCTPMVWDCVIPVFIPVEREETKCYAVGYVNRSEESIRMAAEKIMSNGMYYIPGMKLEKGVDYERA